MTLDAVIDRRGQPARWNSVNRFECGGRWIPPPGPISAFRL